MQAKRYASVAEMRVDLERVVTNSGNGKNTGIIIAIVSAIVLVGGSILWLSNNDEPEEIVNTVVQEPSCEELYNEAINWLAMKDSSHLHVKAIDQLRLLVDEKSYEPAKTKYYTLMLNSNIPDEVMCGYKGLRDMILADSLNSTALFECGLTLSKGNNYFNVPTKRQSLLNMGMNLEEANILLYKAMDLDASDYKSVYWAFNNLMERKLANELPSNDDNELVMLFQLFEKRVANFDDSVAERYRDAVKNDKETLKAWGLIR